jgi:NADPH:quinone reductase-like Zn-dependent oxidoreductase
VRAVAITEWGGRDKLELMDLEPPPVAPDGVLLRVRAAGLNPVDWKTREGRQADRFPYHFPLILGWDAAGIVEEVGAAVTWFRPGDEVFGYLRRHELEYGTYAEFATAPEGFFAPKPPSLSFEEAAALPLAALTAHQGLEAIGLRGGETLYVGGGSGGVGHFVVQLAVARGARVIATASARNQEFLRSLGAEPVDYEEAGDDLVALVRDLATHDGVDAAFDLLGGDGQEEAFAVLRRGGRIVSIVSPPERRDHYEVNYVFARPSGYDLAEMSDLIAEGGLRPHVEATFPLERAADAMERLEAGHVRGKLVLTIG